ncbi:MAG TPA: ABC transporter ATP-binding protein [Acidimicrobiia bacterium]|nr:ABC transporter ATP-binding protein [Acidimicrobiia bacterium]
MVTVPRLAAAALPGRIPGGTGGAPAVAVRHLRRSYAVRGRRRGANEPVEALRGVDLHVPMGEVHGLLGPNGAGKTTLCRILATVLTPTSGTAHIFGFDVTTSARLVRRHIGIVFDGDRGLYPQLTARQNLHFWAALYGVPRRSRPLLARRLLERVGLEERSDERVQGYSRGMRQRLHLARALVGDPPLLLLDEPTTGMDPLAAMEFRAVIGELRRDGRTMLLTTHNMAEAERLCDRVTLIDGGVVVASDRPSALAAKVRVAHRVDAEDVSAEVLTALAAWPDVHLLVSPTPGHLRLEAPKEVVPAVVRYLLDAGVRSLSAGPPDLEETYLAVVGERGMVVRR